MHDNAALQNSASLPPTAPRLTGAQLLTAALIAHDVDTIFGVPGDTGITFYDALAASRIRHVLARDERHAAYMADGYARTSATLGVCEASSGAGAVYLASGLGEAYAASVPVLAITSDIQSQSRGTGAITEIDQEALFSAVTKWHRMAERASDVPTLLSEAIQVATSGRPAPVVLIIPEDVLDQVVPVPVAATVGSSSYPRERSKAPQDRVEQFAAQLAGATRPAILAGGGVHLSGAWDELAQLAEHLAVPVATSIHGKGALREDHPLALGVAGANGARDYTNVYLASSDAVLLVGTRANSTDTNGYTSPPRQRDTVAQIDISVHRAGRNYPGSTALVADAAWALAQLCKAVPAASDELRAERQALVAAARRSWRQTLSAPAAGVEPGQVSARDLVARLRRVYGADTWVVGDPGTPTPFLSAYWETTRRGRGVVIPRGLGPMGYAISAAIGIAVAHPGERVLCLTTESSLAMGSGDWETAGRLKLPITFVVLNNQSMAWIKMLQHLYLDNRYFGVDHGPIDATLIGRGMGLSADAAGDLDTVEILAREAQHRQGPTVIEVRVPEHMTSPPPVAPWQAAMSGQVTHRPIY